MVGSRQGPRRRRFRVPKAAKISKVVSGAHPAPAKSGTCRDSPKKYPSPVNLLPPQSYQQHQDGGSGYAECVPNQVFVSAFSERPPLWEPLFWHSRCRYRRCRRLAGSTPHQSTALLRTIACLLSPQLFGLCRRNAQSSRVFLKDALMHPIGARTRSIPLRSQAAASAERTDARPHGTVFSTLHAPHLKS